ncbi:5-hydroxytryptamine receptor 2B-like [Ornithodoros turicata]|uniref:5-hydroxytryptamine receptor 2B-like n=1 Tax=Ornithodoros turicata TaxID=34597 RepID=UPI00313873F6
MQSCNKSIVVPSAIIQGADPQYIYSAAGALQEEDSMNVSEGNGTENVTLIWHENLVVVITVSILLSLVIVATVIGNIFVMAAILMERNLRTVSNYLVLSLAVADLMVACLVMPLGAVYEVTQEWVLAPELCDVWTCCDVLCCTASILHLLAIAVDRYWAVTCVDYVRRRDVRKVGIMILLVWSVAFVVSIAPIFGWKDDDFHRRVLNDKTCLVSQDVAYQIFATCSSFYVPLIMILLLYWRIFKVARQRIRHKPGAKAVLVVQKDPSTSSALPSTENTPQHGPTAQLRPTSPAPSSSNGMKAVQGGIGRLLVLTKRERRNVEESIESRRERKAAKTVAIITGVFVICWLPFFVMVILMTLFTSCQPSKLLFSFFLWLGYANSMINPIIYTIFSPDFRSAFGRILCGHKPVYR